MEVRRQFRLDTVSPAIQIVNVVGFIKNHYLEISLRYYLYELKFIINIFFLYDINILAY